MLKIVSIIKIKKSYLNGMHYKIKYTIHYVLNYSKIIKILNWNLLLKLSKDRFNHKYTKISINLRLV